MVSDVEDIDLADKESAIFPLIYPEDSDNEEDDPPDVEPQCNHEDLSKPDAMEPILELGPPSKQHTKKHNS